jgi:hypothetical protein
MKKGFSRFYYMSMASLGCSIEFRGVRRGGVMRDTVSGEKLF